MPLTRVFDTRKYLHALASATHKSRKSHASRSRVLPTLGAYSQVTCKYICTHRKFFAGLSHCYRVCARNWFISSEWLITFFLVVIGPWVCHLHPLSPASLCPNFPLQNGQQYTYTLIISAFYYNPNRTSSSSRTSTPL